MAGQLTGVLDQARRDAGLTHGELWLRYFELGGMSSELQLDAFLHGALEQTTHDHNVVVHALNERLVELGGKHPVAYAAEDAPGEDLAR